MDHHIILSNDHDKITIHSSSNNVTNISRNREKAQEFVLGI